MITLGCFGGTTISGNTHMDRVDPKTLNHQAFLKKNLWNGTILALGGSKYTSTVTARRTPCSLSCAGTQENKVQMPTRYFSRTTWSLGYPPTRSLTVRTWKVTFPIGKDRLPVPPFCRGKLQLQGSMYFKNPCVLQYSLNFAPSTQLGS